MILTSTHLASQDRNHSIAEKGIQLWGPSCIPESDVLGVLEAKN